eukprot:331403-Pelagomonas_calceolata.AAC.6
MRLYAPRRQAQKPRLSLRLAWKLNDDRAMQAGPCKQVKMLKVSSMQAVSARIHVKGARHSFCPCPRPA